MFFKITTIAIVAFVATTNSSEVWDGLTARWSVNASDGFYNLPTNLADARKEGWVRITATKKPPGVMVLGFRADPSCALLVSIRTEEVVGLSVALSVADIKKSRVPINYDRKPGFIRRRLNGSYYYTALFMYKEDKSRQMWMEINRKLVEIPTQTDLVISKTRFYSKTCVKWMGHLFYQVNSTTSISDFYPWSLISVGDDIIGFGFQAIGKVDSSTDKRKWFEEGIGPNEMEDAIPDISTELYKAIEEHGIISLRVWLRKNNVEILCSDECTATYKDKGTEESGDCQAIRKRRALGEGNIC